MTTLVRLHDHSFRRCVWGTCPLVWYMYVPALNLATLCVGYLSPCMVHVCARFEFSHFVCHSKSNKYMYIVPPSKISESVTPPLAKLLNESLILNQLSVSPGRLDPVFSS